MACILPKTLQAQADSIVIHRQHHFAHTVPAGNYSGIAWTGGSRYAVVDDKSQTAGFRYMEIKTDCLTGDILEVRADSVLTTSGLPNRDEEGICYVPKTNTLFVSGEADGTILEFTMDGRPTGRSLTIPDVFRTARSNSGFEALTYSEATGHFWTTSECTLEADGPMPTITNKVVNRLRLQSFGDDLLPKEQYWYVTDASFVEKETGTSYLGVSGLASLADGRLVVLERECYKSPKKVGSLVQVKLYIVNPSVQQPGEVLQKELLASFRTKINLTVRSFANYEGICAGPRLADGRQLLILVADSQNQYKGWLKDWFKAIVIPE